MRALLLGGGGREHAIGRALVEGAAVTSLVSAPGNPGLALLGETRDVAINEPAAVVDAAVDADLVVIGPEAPLAAGVADALESKGIPTVGPRWAAARLETSKWYAKHIMEKAGVTTASAVRFTAAEAARGHLEGRDGPYVVKADGLAAGKGVLVTSDRFEAGAWVDHCLGGGFGRAGMSVVIEEFLSGPEISVFALCDGDRAVPFGVARDHKRLEEADQGPNTGGMGCFSPVSDAPDDIEAIVMREVVEPVLAVLAAEGIPYRGFLYVGLVLTASGPSVLEFNCRLGDPEAEVVLPLLRGDLGAILAATAAGDLGDVAIEWSDDHAVDVVLAAAGYPEMPHTGDRISGVAVADAMADVRVFHAGTEIRDGYLLTAGGRVLNVVGLGGSAAIARERAYAAVDAISFDGMQWRSDIGGKQ